MYVYKLSSFALSGFPSQRPLVHVDVGKDVVQQCGCTVSQSMRVNRYNYINVIVATLGEIVPSIQIGLLLVTSI